MVIIRASSPAGSSIVALSAFAAKAYSAQKRTAKEAWRKNSKQAYYGIRMPQAKTAPAVRVRMFEFSGRCIL